MDKIKCGTFGNLPIQKEILKKMEADRAEAESKHEAKDNKFAYTTCIARFFKNMNEKRQARIRRRTLLSVTTCSNCERRLTRCRCGQRKFQIETLDRALNGYN